jgi:hypothetical protein
MVSTGMAVDLYDVLYLHFIFLTRKLICRKLFKIYTIVHMLIVNMLYFRSSFHCTCLEGFSLVRDNKTCIGIAKGPVTLLRMRETYEKRMKINEIIFIRTKIL